MIHKPLFNVYAAACNESGGIYRYTLSENGRLALVSRLPLDSPMYFLKDNDRLHILLRSPKGFGENSAYICCDANATAADMKTAISTEGKVACHLAVLDTDVYAVNYLSGNISQIGKRTVAHVPRPDMKPGRQDAPHTHCVLPSPDSKYLLCTDLGLDRIFVYDKELNEISHCDLPTGCGVRHITFSRDSKLLYSANELNSTVSVFEYSDGVLKYVETHSCNISSKNLAAAIRLSSDGKRLYASQRGEDCVSVFEVFGKSLSFVGNYSIYGNSPRDIYLTPDDRFLLSANEGGSLTVIETKTMHLCDTSPLPDALCVYAEKII